MTQLRTRHNATIRQRASQNCVYYSIKKALRGNDSHGRAKMALVGYPPGIARFSK